MSLCIKEMTPMPDARRPFRNQDRKAWREVGEEGEFSISPNPAPKAPQSSQTEGRLVIPPPYPAPDAHHALAPPPPNPMSPSPLWSPSPSPFCPNSTTPNTSRQPADSRGGSRTEIAKPKFENRKTPRGHLGPRPLHLCIPTGCPHFFLRPSGTNCPPSPDLMSFTSI